MRGRRRRTSKKIKTERTGRERRTRERLTPFSFSFFFFQTPLKAFAANSPIGNMNQRTAKIIDKRRRKRVEKKLKNGEESENEEVKENHMGGEGSCQKKGSGNYSHFQELPGRNDSAATQTKRRDV